MRNSLFIQGAGSQHLFQQLVNKLILLVRAIPCFSYYIIETIGPMFDFPTVNFRNHCCYAGFVA
jgi:hypothetical protein